MAIAEILSKLRASTTIKTLLNATVADDRIYAVPTNYTGNCITWQAYTVSENKIVNNTRLTITIISDTMTQSFSIEQAVGAALLTLGDAPLTSKIHLVELSGGGTLYDYERQKHHRTLYYTVISRSDL